MDPTLECKLVHTTKDMTLCYLLDYLSAGIHFLAYIIAGELAVAQNSGMFEGHWRCNNEY